LRPELLLLAPWVVLACHWGRKLRGGWVLSSRPALEALSEERLDGSAAQSDVCATASFGIAARPSSLSAHRPPSPQGATRLTNSADSCGGSGGALIILADRRALRDLRRGS
jgi:hypothetical protein